MKPAHAKPIAALFFAATAVTTAHAQDARKVAEPAIPPACATLVAGNGPDDGARIQDAIDHCAAGRSVRLTASEAARNFTSGPLTLKSGVTLVVEQNATLLASTDPRRYDSGKGSCGSIDANGKACLPFIALDGGSGSGIMGDGVIDGQGGRLMNGKDETWWQLARRAQRENGKQNVPRLIQLKNARDFTLYRITLRNSPNFHVAMTGVDGFTAWGVKLDTPADARNTDGIDPGSSRNVTIAYSFIRTGDDNIAIKAGSSGPTENVSVLHNHFYNGHGMSIGSETVGGVRNVLVEDLTMDGSVSGLRIKSDPQNGGLVDNVVYRNVCLTGTRFPIEMITHYARRNEGGRTPQFKRIAFEHVHSATPGQVIIEGFDAEHRHGVRLDDVRIAGDARIEHADLAGSIDKTTPASCAQRFVPFASADVPKDQQ